VVVFEVWLDTITTNMVGSIRSLINSLYIISHDFITSNKLIRELIISRYLIGFQSSNILKWSYLKADKDIHEIYDSHLAKNIPPNLSLLSSDRHMSLVICIRMIKMVLILAILIKIRRSRVVGKSTNVDYWLLGSLHSWIYRVRVPQPMCK